MILGAGRNLEIRDLGVVTRTESKTNTVGGRELISEFQSYVVGEFVEHVTVEVERRTLVVSHIVGKPYMRPEIQCFGSTLDLCDSLLRHQTSHRQRSKQKKQYEFLHFGPL